MFDKKIISLISSVKTVLTELQCKKDILYGRNEKFAVGIYIGAWANELPIDGLIFDIKRLEYFCKYNGVISIENGMLTQKIQGNKYSCLSDSKKDIPSLINTFLNNVEITNELNIFKNQKINNVKGNFQLLKYWNVLYSKNVIFLNLSQTESVPININKDIINMVLKFAKVHKPVMISNDKDLIRISFEDNSFIEFENGNIITLDIPKFNKADMFLHSFENLKSLPTECIIINGEEINKKVYDLIYPLLLNTADNKCCFVDYVGIKSLMILQSDNSAIIIPVIKKEVENKLNV